MRQPGHDHCADGPADAEGEVAVARLVMAGGDLAHALRHVADALALDPRLPDAHEALAELVALAGGGAAALGLFDQTDEPEFIGTVAARAQVCASAGRWDEAVQLLLSVAAHQPDRPWLDVAWLRRADLPDLVDPGVIISGTAGMVQRLDDPVDEDRRAPLLPALTLLRACVSRHPEHAMLLWCGSMLARRLGAFDEAIAWAERSFEVQPSHEAAVMKGYALRTAGRLDEALTAWTAEIERTPDDLDLYVDVADLLHTLNRTEDALGWARRAISRDPEHSRAVSTAHGLRFAIDGDASHLVALADQLRARPDQDYPATVLARLCDGRTWLGIVSGPTESVTNVLSQMLANGGPGRDSELTLTVSAIESPSALLTLRSAFPKATVSIDRVPKPDPRAPLRRVRHAVWDYRRKEARPAVPPPTPEVAEAVRRIATVNWASPPEAYDRAVALSGLDLLGLLGVLVHPPDPLDDELGRLLRRHHPELWVRAVQTWACLGIGHHQADQPWASSLRREVLADLLNGPEDWVTEAAGFALIATAWQHPPAREDVQALMVRRLVDALAAYRKREVTILGSLCQLVLITPQLADESATLARDVLTRLRESST
jgi:tetratricopeptide (TPR) repeat protein